MTTRRDLGDVFSVCVFCGARPGGDPAHADLARRTGRAIAARGMRLVYGAGDVGLMGEVARAAMDAGAPTLGVIPQHLMDLEVGKRDLTELVVTQTMHERKTLMFRSADAVLALPGGAGTLDELVEVMTWRQLGLHDKPVALVDRAFWAPFLALLDHIVACGFAGPALRDSLIVADEPDEALEALAVRRDRPRRPPAARPA